MSAGLRITDLSPKLNSTMTILRIRAKSKSRSRIRCSSESNAVALKLTTEVAKRKALLAQRREALEKSTDILFTELSLYLSMDSHELCDKWKLMDEDQKWDLVSRFVSDWALNFHPLSVRSVKELVDEKILADHNGNSESKEDSLSSSSASFFPNLNSLIGLEHLDDFIEL